MRIDAVAAALVLAVIAGACTGSDPDIASPADGGSSGDDGGLACAPDQKKCDDRCVALDDPRLGCGEPTCAPCAAPPDLHVAAACNGGKCATTCAPGYADCDGDAATGCETHVDTDPANCGACKNACGSAHTTAAPTCSAGKCAFACESGYAHCGADSAGCDVGTMTDAKNCGRCKADCFGGTCTAGECSIVTIASTLGSVTDIAVDTAKIFASGYDRGGIYAIPKTQSPVCTQADCPVVASGADVEQPGGIVADDTFVFWANSDGSGGVRDIERVAVGGGAASSVAQTTGSSRGTLAISGATLFFGASLAATDRVFRNALTGSPPATTFATGDQSGSGTVGVVADDTHVYWASTGVFSNAVNAAACDQATTCTTLVPAPAAGGMSVLGADKDNLYYGVLVSGVATIYRVAKKGGTPVVIATNQDLTRSIVADGAWVYWANGYRASGTTSQTIRRAPADTLNACDGAACALVTNASNALLAIDAAALYWYDGNGAHLRLRGK